MPLGGIFPLGTAHQRNSLLAMKGDHRGRSALVLFASEGGGRTHADTHLAGNTYAPVGNVRCARCEKDKPPRPSCDDNSGGSEVDKRHVST